MSGSFPTYRGYTFQAKDVDLQIWLYLVICELDRHNSGEGWLKELREEWLFQATSDLVGLVWPQLDRFADTEEHRVRLLSLCESTYTSLLARGQTLDQYEIKEHGIGGRVTFPGDIPVKRIAEVGALFIKLLRGDVSSDERIQKAVPPESLLK